MDGAELTIAHEFLLLGHHPDTGTRLVNPLELDCGAAGAILAQLALAERIALQGERVAVVKAAPLGDRFLDSVLAQLASRHTPRPATWWVNRLKGAGLRGRLLTDLVRRGALRSERQSVFRVFSLTRYPAGDAAGRHVSERVRAVFDGTHPPDHRTVALFAILDATRLDRKILHDVPRHVRAQRVAAIAQGDAIGPVVRKVIRSVHAATAGAAAAAGAAGVAAGGAG
ncbi:GOLPH3/VPS74 family protein [Allonocardiopsis opalescens]|uniref:Golgi phosphoprotein 3 GPP34 n=1 Tax=Allonocardiopsis opalescens TaxID=1144618 RepID=A0A2T0Q9F1_9ACTN|nr:GPP34 family phosphoprotein [Allonocardiopsis opalescens]PRY00519.1 Golgi phosphoprotein 3 GPP34 [Allonocardiopsis opalescens]